MAAGPKYHETFAIVSGRAIPLLLVLLFAYTGTAKLLAPGMMVGHLETVGFPGTWAKAIAVTVPVAELFTAVLLVSGRYRITGLWLATAALLFFTVYVAVILSGSHIPCTCGGIMAAMSWRQHLYFNGTFLLLSAVSLYYNNIMRI